jgi:hypothetical protein
MGRTGLRSLSWSTNAKIRSGGTMRPSSTSWGWATRFPSPRCMGRTRATCSILLVESFPEQLEEEEDESVKIAIVGKPNAGKSSLLNKLVGEERAIVSPIPGTTRDATDTKIEVNGPGSDVDRHGGHPSARKDRAGRGAVQRAAFVQSHRAGGRGPADDRRDDRHHVTGCAHRGVSSSSSGSRAW